MVTTTENPLTALREEYEELFQKKPFMGWGERELQERISKEEARKENANERPFLPQDIVPVVMKGKLYCIVGNEYKTMTEAKIIALRNQIAIDQKQLSALEALLSNEQ